MKNYMICIGGSGARVLRAVTHISACGLLRMENLEVVLIDPDKDTKTTTMAVDELKDYQEITRIYGGNRHFRPSVTHFRQRKNDSYIISPMAENVNTLLDLCKTEPDSEDIMSWFFRKNEREQNLDKGFYARPAIGSVFFSNFRNEDISRLFDAIIGTLRNQEPVNLMFIGSVFGGTGASGIPTLLKLLAERLEKEGRNGNELFRYLNTAAVFILPYFNVLDAETKARENAEIAIQVGSFTGNTRQALYYYDAEQFYGNFTADNCRKFQNIYLVGQSSLDDVCEYAVGSAGQKNKAHIVELYSALAVADYFGRITGGTNQEDREGIFVFARQDQLTWKSFPVPFGYQEGDVRRNIASFVRFSVFFIVYLYESLYDTARNGLDGVNVYDRKRIFRKEQWYYRLIDRKDEALKRNMNIIRAYCADFLKWFYEINAVYTSEPAERGKLVLKGDTIKLVDEKYESVYQFLLEQTQTGAPGTGERSGADRMEKLKKDIVSNFESLITEEESTGRISHVISELNDSSKYKENYVKELIDRLYDVLEEEYR